MNAILKKLRIKPPHRFFSIDAPPSFESIVSEGVEGCTFTTDPLSSFDSIHWFVKNQAEVEAGVDRIFKMLKPGVPVWVYYPKGGGGIKTDLNRDKGWEAVMANPDIRWVAMISFDPTWTAFSFRLKTDKDLKEEAKPQPEREIFKYIDRSTKTITLPEDIRTTLEQNLFEWALFHRLSFSNQCEYLEWIVTAKQEKTRQARLEGMLERLRKGWRNPAGR